MKYTIVLIFITGVAFAGFDGAQAPGGAQTGGAPMAAQDGGIGFADGKPAGAGAGSGKSSVSTPGKSGMGGKGKGDGSGPWGSKGAMGGQRGGGKGR